jgi:hypothetical protein
MTVLLLSTHQMNQPLLWSRRVTSPMHRMTLRDHESHRKSTNIHEVFVATKILPRFLQTRTPLLRLLQMMTQWHLVPHMIGL